ncbi:MAG: CYTH domain-containing protein [Verrucomicrobia bacterium]|nr:CYTH domain-containing protein [Verrucomicrobiota bacterium]
MSLALSGLLALANAGPASPPDCRKAEVKFLVDQDDLVSAKVALQKAGVALETSQADRLVCFFDTADRQLDQKGLIVRVRARAGGKADLVVKLRGQQKPSTSVQPEEECDVVSPHDVKRSFKVESKPTAGEAEPVLAGQVSVETLLKGPPASFLAACLQPLELPKIQWLRYGPVAAWKWEGALPDFPAEVTVELWKMSKAGAEKELLEVSIKVNESSQAAQEEAIAKFYAAVAKLGLGKGAAKSKTSQVLDFYHPLAAPK